MLTYSTVKTPIFSAPDNSAVQLTVKFDHIAFECDFNATPNDIELHGVELYNRAMAGDFGPIGAYVPTAVDENGQANQPQPTTSGSQVF